jgi:ATP adenylyltransferase
MQQIWAPWRGELVEKPEGMLPEGCPFCMLPRAHAEPGERKAKDRDTLVLGRTANTFALLNRWPYNNGHLMVIPRKHTARFDDFSSEEWVELGEMIRVATKILQDAYQPQGVNLGMNLGKAAGAGIPDHLHWHFVPRWNGDTNFMPVLADTKVMIEHIQASWDRMRPLFEERYQYGGASLTDWPADGESKWPAEGESK